MYKITITELQEIQNLLKEIDKIKGDNAEQLTTKLLIVKMKARLLSSKIERNFLKIKG
jgi:hypothetical protein